MSDPLETHIRAFLDSDWERGWIRTPEIELYLRRGFLHLVAGQPYQLLDLGDVNVAEGCRRQGIFSRALALLQELTPFDGVLVENIHSDILREYLVRLKAKDARWVQHGMHFTWIKEPRPEFLWSRETKVNYLQALGYNTDHARELPDGRVAWIHRLMYTAAILLARLPNDGYDDRWCYTSLDDAQRALGQWDPATTSEPTGWHRHPPSGRRRPDGDPAKEYVSH